MTLFDRRSFFKTGCFAACAGALGSGQTLAAVLTARFTRTLPMALPLRAAEEAMLAFVSRYATRVRMVGLPVLLKLRGAEVSEAHWLVELTDSTAFGAALTGPSPFAGAFSAENTLSLVRDGIEFTIENLPPAAFAQRLTELATRKNLAFAHDALIYDPATRSLTDPFGGEKSRSVKLVNATVAGGAAISMTMRGRLEARRLGTETDASFAAWQARNLPARSERARTAVAVAEAFLGKCANLAESSAPEAMKSLVASTAVSSALLRVFGLSAERVVADYDRLRPEISGEVSNAALWLALLLGPEIESEASDGAATTWLQSGTHFDVLRSRAALAAARRFLQASF